MANWSILIAKAQAGELPPVLTVPDLNSFLLSPDALAPSPHAKIFTTDLATFSLEPKPGMLPDCLVNMALNRIFIPLSMLTTVALNNIEMNQDVKYK